MIISIIDAVLFFVAGLLLLNACYPFTTWGVANLQFSAFLADVIVSAVLGLALLVVLFFLEKKHGSKGYLFARLAIITQVFFLGGFIGLMSATGFDMTKYSPYCGILALALLVVFTIPFWKRAKDNKANMAKAEGK